MNKCSKEHETHSVNNNTPKAAIITSILGNIVTLLAVLITVTYQLHTLKTQLDRTQKAQSHEMLLHKQMEMALEFSPILERLLTSSTIAGTYIEHESRNSSVKDLTTTDKYQELMAPVRADIALLAKVNDKYSIVIPNSLKVRLIFANLCETMLLQDPKRFPGYFIELQSALRDSIGVDQLGDEYMRLIRPNIIDVNERQKDEKN